MLLKWGNIDDFWSEELTAHKYVRTVPFEAKNFNHLDKTFYDRGYLLQSFNEELPAIYEKFYDALGVERGSVSWTCILPNVILPTHRDTFYTLRTEKNIDISECCRYLIFLEDWTFGHYVEFENQHITKWKKGDVWLFDSEELHYAANASNQYFHSCQVSTTK